MRATVAQIEVSNLVGNTVDGLLARLARKRPLAPIAFAREAATVAAAVPIAVPLLATAGVMRVAAASLRRCPRSTCLRRAKRTFSCICWRPPRRRTSPTRWSVSRCSACPDRSPSGYGPGRTAATVRIGRGKLAVENGISRDTIVVVEGEVEPLLQLATGSIVRELSSVRIRPS